MRIRKSLWLCLCFQIMISGSTAFVSSVEAAPAATVQGTGAKSTAAVSKANVQVSGPFCNENLAIYLIRGPQKIKGTVLTLGEALAKKQVVVQETSNVNELTVQNLSNAYVFLQSGDIVKGGKQDRTVQYDMMLQPHSGKVSLPCFCVEHDRWQQRGAESDASFGSSQDALASKDLKLAAKKYGDQSSVWDNVAKVQGKLCHKVSSTVAASPSPSSLQLTLENKKLREATQAHLNKFNSLPEGKNDVIGFAFAINGKINSADVYASNELFKKLWPKLLKSSDAEAIAEEDKKFDNAPSSAAVQKFLAEAESKPELRKAGQGGQYEMTEQESSHALMYKTKWYSAPRQMQVLDSRPSSHAGSSLPPPPCPSVHTNYIAK